MQNQPPVPNPLAELIEILNSQRTLLDNLSKAYGPLDTVAEQAKSGIFKLLDAAEKLQKNSKTVSQYQQELSQASPVSFTVNYDPSHKSKGLMTTGSAELSCALPDGTTFTRTQNFAHEPSTPQAVTLMGSQLDIEGPSYEVIDFDSNRLPISVEPSVLEKMMHKAIPDLEGKVTEAIQQSARLRALQKLAQECNASGDHDACEAFASEANMSPSEFLAQVDKHGYSSKLVAVLAPAPESTQSLQQTMEAEAPQKPQEAHSERESGPSLG